MEAAGVQIIVAIIFGAICASIAQSRGRSAIGWFVVGVFISCFGVILLLVLPDLRLEDERHGRLTRDNRRLREQIKTERTVADRRHETTEKRLGVHDRALDVDTSRLAEPEALASPPPTPVLDSSTRAAFEAAEWYFIRDEQQTGPVAFAELKRLWRTGDLGSANYLWHEAMDDWRKLGDLPELGAAFRA